MDTCRDRGDRKDPRDLRDLREDAGNCDSYFYFASSVTLGHFGHLEAWPRGCMVSWRHGLLEAWSLGGMVTWRLGLVEAWSLGGLVSWMHGLLVPNAHANSSV